MPLNKEHGEVLEGLDASAHVVIDHRHVAALDNVLVEYEAPGKFRPVKKRRPLFDDALAYANAAFMDAGAAIIIRPDESGILTQIYPKESKLAVIFLRKIKGEEHFVTRIYDLPREVIPSLLDAAGKTFTEH